MHHGREGTVGEHGAAGHAQRGDMCMSVLSSHSVQVPSPLHTQRPVQTVPELVFMVILSTVKLAVKIHHHIKSS